MKRSLQVLLLSCLALTLLTGTAFADMGPKPQLIVRVQNPPEEPYVLDLLAEGEPDACSTLTDEDFAAEMRQLGVTDSALYYALTAAVPAGWHACLSQPSGAPIFGKLTGAASEGEMLHQLSYYGVPTTYRILMVTASGEILLSQAYTREVLQSSVSVDWAAKTVTIPPTSTAYAVQFTATFFPTLLVEGLLLALFGLGSRRKNWACFLLVNLITQGSLAVFFGVNAVRHGVSGGYPFLLIAAELAVMLAEYLLYRRFLTGRSPERITAYAITANACTAVLGFIIAEPLWRFVVSIL